MRKIIGFIVLLALVGGAVFWGWNYLGPKWAERQREKIFGGDKNSKVIRIGGDNYLGYFFLISPEMRKQCAANGLRIDFQDDGGAYADRLARFKNKKLDLIVLPISSYLQHGAKHGFPGAIVASISESRGGDGIVGFASALRTGNLNSDLNNPNLTFVFTPDSPSSFLLDQVITHFDLFNLKGGNLRALHVNGSREVLEKIKKREGDIFVLWEPDLSEALQVEGIKYIWGSDQFSGLIIDTMVFRWDFIKDNRDDVLKFLKIYFRVMSIYRNNKELWFKDMREKSGLKKDALEKLMREKKVEWYDLQANCNLQFGIGPPGRKTQEGAIDAIVACTDILIRSKVLPSDPTNGDPYSIVDKDRSILKELAKELVVPVASQPQPLNTLGPLTEEGWRSLRPLGSMQSDNVTFQFGKDLLDEQGKVSVGQIALKLKNNYPDHWMFVRGHTADGEDESANRALSLRRAQTTIQYMKALGISEYRLRAEGVGSALPPEKRPDEIPRAYRSRRSRVEFVLMERPK